MNELRIESVGFDHNHVTVRFTDAKQLRISLAHFPRLQSATAEERNSWELIGRGRGVHWEAADEDLSVENFLTAYSRERTGKYTPLTK
jgi:Protein of unknown function (DUF2442)